MKTKVLLILFFCCSVYAHATQVTGTWLYKGSIDGKMPVTLYLNATDPCGGHMIYDAIYKYDSKSKWLQLSIQANEQEEYCMTESGFTGVLLLRRSGKELKGVWVSPDRKRTLSVILIQQVLSPEEKQKLETAREQVNYELNDC